MKKVRITLVTTAILLLCFAGCDKHHLNRTIGNWDFITERIYYNLVDGTEEKRDTIYYSGKIESGNSEDNDVIYIQYLENRRIKAWIEASNGSTQIYPLGDMAAKFPTGEFESKNKMHFRVCWGKDLIEPSERMDDYVIGTRKKGGKK
jgi:hypothetical protein